jgi:hypothetical protein
MRSKNSRAIDPLESAYMRDVKLCACVVCDWTPPSDCHHPQQGLHLTGVALCKECHGGPGYPHGWHGDKSRWRAAKMTELRAINETRRRVEILRSGGQLHPRRNTITAPAPKRKGSALTSSKIIPRAA